MLTMSERVDQQISARIMDQFFKKFWSGLGKTPRNSGENYDKEWELSKLSDLFPSMLDEFVSLRIKALERGQRGRERG